MKTVPGVKMWVSVLTETGLLKAELEKEGRAL